MRMKTTIEFHLNRIIFENPTQSVLLRLMFVASILFFVIYSLNRYLQQRNILVRHFSLIFSLSLVANIKRLVTFSHLCFFSQKRKPFAPPHFLFSLSLALSCFYELIVYSSARQQLIFFSKKKICSLFLEIKSNLFSD